MLEWLSEINWIMVISVTAGVLGGMELGRRRAEKRGEIYSFLPRSTHRILTLGSGLSGVFFYEAARMAVSMPTTFHVWILIFFAAVAFIIFGSTSGLELKSAKALIAGEEKGANEAADAA